MQVCTQTFWKPFPWSPTWRNRCLEVVFSQTYLAEPVQARTPRSAAQHTDWDTQPGAHRYTQVVGVPLTFCNRECVDGGDDLISSELSSSLYICILQVDFYKSECIFVAYLSAPQDSWILRFLTIFQIPELRGFGIQHCGWDPNHI